MTRSLPDLPWIPAISPAARPLYRAIADALENDIHSGRLAVGTRLPPQRLLADALGIDFTTVSRAYTEASRRGLVEGRVGQGTFVRPGIRAAQAASRMPSALGHPAPASLADPRMNVPPLPEGPEWRERIRQGIGAFAASADPALLLRYQQAGGAEADREAGAAWLTGRVAVPAERLLVCAGAQGALLALLSMLCEPGDLICCEALTYPGFRSLAAHLRLRLAGLAMDSHGLLPDAFEEACRGQRPKALYCIPTLHNPTIATLPLARRQALVAIARRHGVPIIEDDAYGALLPGAPPPMAALGPDIVYHVSGLAKCVSPALRIAYLAVPDARQAGRLSGAIRATVGMASPVTAALATRWIGDGTAAAILAGIQAETAARHAIAADMLPAAQMAADPAAFHLWLRLPAGWSRGEFMSRLRPAEIGMVSSDAFALSVPPEALRIALGAPPGRQELRAGLRHVADLLAQAPAMSWLIV
ncbi:aminotransferase-like domain-containing protein [Teichococcus oryzae]|uniref:PLP-dependent aminotransferase family protein n=1 Tax=Teichococcus oryzae TaxID=1608942 RepID=A0A5B2TIJ0_9PROT|nr:PLP-dependent aminotransferase family protein [Pseudoroseomonas oryzae]KAA2214307.1 PLP-dependent aminotransferase family protein [Pseudoroseomonas oryzae]